MNMLDVAAGAPGGQDNAVRMRGFIRAVARDENGDVVSERRTANMVVDNGRSEIMKLIATSGGGNRISHAGVGTSSATVTNTNTDLAVATGARVAVTPSLNVGTADFTFSFASTDVNTTLREVGLFASSSGGTLFARAVHGDIVKTTAMTLAYTYQLQLSTN